MGRANLQAMNIFVRVVETKSFVNAARALLIDPSVISRAIKGLETDLGALLFSRSTRALKLTDEGGRFYRDCVQNLQKLEESMRQFRADSETPQGLLKVGMTPGMTKRLVMRALPEFQSRNPKIKTILLSIGDNAEIATEGIDVVVRPCSLRKSGRPRPEPEGLVIRKLAQSGSLVVASPAYLSRAGTPKVPQDLLRHDCIAHITVDRDVQDEYRFARAQTRQTIRFVPQLLVNGTDGLREAALAGCGIIRLLACHIDDELRSGALVPILGDWQECSWTPPIAAYYRKTNPMPPQLNAFVRYLSEHFRQYNAGPRV